MDRSSNFLHGADDETQDDYGADSAYAGTFIETDDDLKQKGAITGSGGAAALNGEEDVNYNEDIYDYNDGDDLLSMDSGGADRASRDDRISISYDVDGRKSMELAEGAWLDLKESIASGSISEKLVSQLLLESKKKDNSKVGKGWGALRKSVAVTSTVKKLMTVEEQIASKRKIKSVQRNAANNNRKSIDLEESTVKAAEGGNANTAAGVNITNLSPAPPASAPGSPPLGQPLGDSREKGSLPKPGVRKTITKSPSSVKNATPTAASKTTSKDSLKESSESSRLKTRLDKTVNKPAEAAPALGMFDSFSKSIADVTNYSEL